MVYSCAAYVTGGCEFEPHQYLWTPYLQVCRAKRLGCHADLYTVSRCHTRGEFEDNIGKEAHKRCTLALKLKADIISSNQKYLWPHKKDLCPPKKKYRVFKIY